MIRTMMTEEEEFEAKLKRVMKTGKEVEGHLVVPSSHYCSAIWCGDKHLWFVLVYKKQMIPYRRQKIDCTPYDFGYSQRSYFHSETRENLFFYYSPCAIS